MCVFFNMLKVKICFYVARHKEHYTFVDKSYLATLYSPNVGVHEQTEENRNASAMWK
jgi:hypothetical protein